MGYRVEYQPLPKVRGLEKRVSRFPAVLAGVILALLVFFCAVWPEGIEDLRMVIFPGNPKITGEALETMVWNLRAGEDLSDALMVFCQQILEETELASD